MNNAVLICFDDNNDCGGGDVDDCDNDDSDE